MPKGQTNNPNGRPKGSANVITKEVRATLKAIIAGELERLPETLETLDASKRLDVVLKLIPYVLPRVDSINMNSGESFALDEWT